MKSQLEIKNILDFLIKNLILNDFKGWDPYDLLNNQIISKILPGNKQRLILTQVNRISPINFRPILSINKIYNSKAMALILLSFLNLDKNNKEIEFVLNWLIDNKCETYKQYSIGFTFDITMNLYSSSREESSLIITLFVMYAFIEYYKKTKNKHVFDEIISFRDLIEKKIPKFENRNILWYSYNFNKINEIFNATAKIGKFYSLLFTLIKDENLLIKIDKILNYLSKKQRHDGSWPYGEKIVYTDGFHTAFVLEAILYMRKVVDKPQYENMFFKGLKNYKKYFFKETGQPLYFHPFYKHKELRRYLIETDIRDCAMAIVLFSKLRDKKNAEKVYKWTIAHMYNKKNGYFFYYKNKLWTNKIEFIRWQAWMLYALSELAPILTEHSLTLK